MEAQENNMVETKYKTPTGIFKEWSDDELSVLIASEFKGKMYENWYRLDVPYTSKKGKEMQGAWIPEDPIANDKVEFAFSMGEEKGVKFRYLKYLGIVE